MPRRFLPSPALALGVIALVVALGATAYASPLRTSRLADVAAKTRSATVTRAQAESLIARYFDAHRRALRGADGKAGPAGATGAVGPTGAPGAPGVDGTPGAPGAPGTIPALAPSGMTQTGAFAIGGYQVTGQDSRTSISFPFALASAPTVDEVLTGSTDAHCTGTSAAPTAAPGYLCLYIANDFDVTPITGLSVYPQNLGNSAEGASPFGAMLTAQATTTGDMSIEGSWAVAAP
jgi:hypothetical protein